MKISKNMWILFGFIFAVLLAVFIFNYVFSVYETKYELSTSVLYSDGNTTAVLLAIPINAWGFKAPFRNSNTRFEFEEGAGKVEVLIKDEVRGVLKIRSKQESGKVVIRATPKNSLLPTVFEILIYPNQAMLSNGEL